MRQHTVLSSPSTLSLDLLSAELSLGRYRSGDKDPRKWGGGGGGKRKTASNAPLSPPVWFCFEIGSDMSHLNVTIFVTGKVTTLSTHHNYEEQGEPRSNRIEARQVTGQPSALPLGQTIDMEGGEGSPAVARLQ